MTSPFDMLPADPEWVDLVDKLAIDAGERLGSMVVLIAMQPDGAKMACAIEGPTTGALAELAKDVPRLLFTLASLLARQEAAEAQRPRQ